MNDVVKCPLCVKKSPHEPTYNKMVATWTDLDWEPLKFDQAGKIIPKINLKEARLMRCHKGHDFTVSL